MTSKMNLALACFLAAAAWPWLVGKFASLLMSPLDRAAQSAWCGLPMRSSYELLGHCAACWVGSALLSVVGVLVLKQVDRRAPALTTRS
ncbi:MAG: hypothetical protein HY054_02475 [Proteobacteria bacterium]|nr:hypothetical protein [Pseudomonadota bacterium]